MALGLLDLSAVTKRLLDLLTDARDNGPIIKPDPFTIDITGKPPDLSRQGDHCQIGLYLFHVNQDAYQRNSPVTGPRVPPLPAQPLSLDLYYLLTASSPAGSFDEEQRALSMALRCFHENPAVRILDATNNELARLCLTMESETTHDIGRLWQAAAVSMRVCAVYRVSVVFLQAPPPPAVAAEVQKVSLSVYPSLPAAGVGPFVAGTVTTVRYLPPGLAPGATQPQFDLFPARVTAGQAFSLYGSGFATPGGSVVYLLTPPGAEEDVTAWRNAARSTDSRHALTVPVGDAHAPGVYQLRVGNNKPLGDPAAQRSAATPFSLAPFVDPTGGPLLPAPSPGSPFVLSGGGFSPGQAEAYLGPVTLTPRGGGAPQAGEFVVLDAATIQFLPPKSLPTGVYPVRVRVNDVESLPAQWVQQP
jgi:hypothetical protein